MTIAEELQRDADLAKSDGGMYYSGLYLQGYADQARSLEAENENMSESIKHFELLLEILRNDCDIDASWDGLRKFWNIQLTDGGVLMRDRANDAEAENSKLRELLKSARNCIDYGGCKSCYGMCGGCTLDSAMRELGIEVDA